MTKNYTLNGR